MDRTLTCLLSPLTNMGRSHRLFFGVQNIRVCFSEFISLVLASCKCARCNTTSLLWKIAAKILATPIQMSSLWWVSLWCIESLFHCVPSFCSRCGKGTISCDCKWKFWNRTGETAIFLLWEYFANYRSWYLQQWKSKNCIHDYEYHL
jgi:hypothetical protein